MRVYESFNDVHSSNFHLLPVGEDPGQGQVAGNVSVHI